MKRIVLWALLASLVVGCKHQGGLRQRKLQVMNGRPIWTEETTSLAHLRARAADRQCWR
jgi:hypothetical protein